MRLPDQVLEIIDSLEDAFIKHTKKTGLECYFEHLEVTKEKTPLGETAVKVTLKGREIGGRIVEASMRF